MSPSSSVIIRSVKPHFFRRSTGAFMARWILTSARIFSSIMSFLRRCVMGSSRLLRLRLLSCMMALNISSPAPKGITVQTGMFAAKVSQPSRFPISRKMVRPSRLRRLRLIMSSITFCPRICPHTSSSIQSASVALVVEEMSPKLLRGCWAYQSWIVQLSTSVIAPRKPQLLASCMEAWT